MCLETRTQWEKTRSSWFWWLWWWQISWFNLRKIPSASNRSWSYNHRLDIPTVTTILLFHWWAMKVCWGCGWGSGFKSWSNQYYNNNNNNNNNNCIDGINTMKLFSFAFPCLNSLSVMVSHDTQACKQLMLIVISFRWMLEKLG